jgi:hypothetical protein
MVFAPYAAASPPQVSHAIDMSSFPTFRRVRSPDRQRVVALQAQRQAERELSTLAPIRALWARTSEPAWARRAVDEGVRSCPRAGCERSARLVSPPSGPAYQGRLSLTSCDIFHVAGGMIVGHLGMGDIAGVLAQLKR